MWKYANLYYGVDDGYYEKNAWSLPCDIDDDVNDNKQNNDATC